MENMINGNVSALKDHLLKNHRVSQLDALILFGVQRLPGLINSMRKEGFIVQTERISMIKVIVRLNKYCSVTPPKNLPTKEVFVTDYWVAK